MVTTEYSQVLECFECVRELRNQRLPSWSARCPAHEDRTPSLLLTVSGYDARLMAYCRAGCRWADIVRASRTKPEAWFPERDNNREVRRVSNIVATYDYRDARGQLLYQVVRYEPKDFRQRRPTGRAASATDPWTWNLEGVESVPYNLPELLRKREWPVIVVEGEKDADRLSRLGLLATTNSGGAGKWGFYHGRHLRGRRVAILPDNDHPGHAHAMTVAGNLLYWGAASVRIVHLPDAEDGGDVSDWLDGFGDVKAEEKKRLLVEIIRLADEYAAGGPK